MNSETKQCRVCGVTKPLSSFYPRHDAADGRRNDCKPCSNKRNAKRDTPDEKARNTYNVRNSKMRKQFGITVDEYDDGVAILEGYCQLCGMKPYQLAVDYDAETQTVRGLLCLRCLRGLRKVNPATLNVLLSTTTDLVLLGRAQYLLDPPGLPRQEVIEASHG